MEETIENYQQIRCIYLQGRSKGSLSHIATHRKCRRTEHFLLPRAKKLFAIIVSKLSPVRGIHDFEELLFDDVRLDEEIFYEPAYEKIRIAPLYHKTNLDQLVKLLEKRG